MEPQYQTRVRLLRSALHMGRAFAKVGTRDYDLCEEAVHYGLLERKEVIGTLHVYAPVIERITEMLEAEGLMQPTMTCQERAKGRREIIAIAIRWGQGEPRPHNPRDVRRAMAASAYGLPALVPGDSEQQWAAKIALALAAERRQKEHTNE